MEYTLEQIDSLRQRVDVTYEEAKEALERSNGDTVEALIWLENKKKAKKCCSSTESNYFINAVKKIVKKGNDIKFVMEKEDKTVINVPLNAAILTTVAAPQVTIGGVVAALCTNHKMKFVKPDGTDMEVNKVFDKMSSKVDDIKSTI